MSSQELTNRVQKLKLGLEEVQKQLEETKIDREALEDLKSAVDHTRMTIWAILTTPGSDMNLLTSNFRMKHTIDMCQRIILDVVGGVPLDPKLFNRLQATLEDTLKRLKQG